MSRLTRGTGRLNPSRETKFSGLYGDRGIFIFPVQLTTSRIGNLTLLIHTLLYVMTTQTYIHNTYIHTYIHTYVHTYIHTYIHKYKWHRMTRVSGPDCAVMCNLIYIHTYILLIVLLRSILGGFVPNFGCLKKNQNAPRPSDLSADFKNLMVPPWAQHHYTPLKEAQNTQLPLSCL